jgi:formylglycine-generating enzyme required for sulfatase activity
VACGAHQSCTTSAGKAACTCNGSATCTAVGNVCATTSTLATCAQDAQGCFYESASTPCTNGACSVGACCTNACTIGAGQCVTGGLETCATQSNGCTAWASAVTCPAGTPNCNAGACGTPPSCQVIGAGTTTCGASSESCCTSSEVPGGAYDRTYDPVNSEDGGITVAADGEAAGLADPATVSGFRLDNYLITVGRFRRYVDYLTSSAGAPPPGGSGKHTHLNGGLGLVNCGDDAGVTYETGWDATDWDQYIPTGSGAAAQWNANLTSCASQDTSTWTVVAASNENLPIDCINWYEAYAFCIWDGGFLPSEAEWGYAAAGGSQQREYPWGSRDPGTTTSYAIYNCNYEPDGTCTAFESGPLGVQNIAPVGTATLGTGLWGQFDLAGELNEWNLDFYYPYVDPCTNCAYLVQTVSVVVRGGNFDDYLLGNLLASANLGDYSQTDRGVQIGARCARAP